MLEIMLPMAVSSLEYRRTWVEVRLKLDPPPRRETAYHFPGLPIPSDQVPIISFHRGIPGLDQECDSRTTDLRVDHHWRDNVVPRVQRDYFLKGYFVRRTIQEVKEVDVDGATENHFTYHPHDGETESSPYSPFDDSKEILLRTYDVTVKVKWELQRPFFDRFLMRG